MVGEKLPFSSLDERSFLRQFWDKKAMKKVTIYLTAVIALVCLTTKLSAQYSIPSYNVTIVSNPTTFVEISQINDNNNSNISESVLYFADNIEKTTLIVKVKESNSSTHEWTIFEIYTLNTLTFFGTYSVCEGDIFSIELDASYDWGIRTISSSSDCIIDVYFE